MAGDYWEETVYSASPLDGLERTDAPAAFDWLELNFPVMGSKIDWRNVQGKHTHWEVDDDLQLASTAAEEVCRRIRPGSFVEHAGDGISPYGVRFTDDNAPVVIAALLEVPEHHYFLAEDRSWMVVVATEGDLDVVDLRGGCSVRPGAARVDVETRTGVGRGRSSSETKRAGSDTPQRGDQGPEFAHGSGPARGDPSDRPRSLILGVDPGVGLPVDV